MKTLAIFLTLLTFVLTPFSWAKTVKKNAFSIAIIELNHPSCEGGTNGSALVEAKGGVGPYSYNWNTFPNQYEQKAVDLSAGTYFVHVTDAVGNKFYETVVLADPEKEQEEELIGLLSDAPSVEVLPISQAPQKPEGPLFMRLNGEPVATIDYNALVPGLYDLEIIDANNCATISILQVFEYERLDAEEVLAAKLQEQLSKPRVQLISYNDRER